MSSLIDPSTIGVQVLGPLEIFFNFALLGAGLVVIYLFGFVSAIQKVDEDYKIKRGLAHFWRKTNVEDLEGEKTCLKRVTSLR